MFFFWFKNCEKLQCLIDFKELKLKIQKSGTVDHLDNNADINMFYTCKTDMMMF